MCLCKKVKNLSRRSKTKQPKRNTVTFSAKDFLPTTREEMDALGWDYCDIILVSGDAYIDSPFIGVAMVGRMLERMGYKVGMIGQPDIKVGDDIM